MNGREDRTWSALLAAGVVQGAAPATEKLSSPWYVKVLLAFSGWLAALFMLGFIGVGLDFLMKSATAAIIGGSVMLVIAFVILNQPQNEFFEHLGLAVSLAGQALVVMAIFKLTRRHEILSWTLTALLQVCLALFMPQFIHRVFSAFFAALALAMVLYEFGAPYIFGSVVMFGAAWLWLHEFTFPRQMAKIRPIAYGLILAMILLKATIIASRGELHMLLPYRQPHIWVKPWMGELLAAAVILYVVLHLLHRYKQPFTGRLAVPALAATLVLAAVSFEAQGITAGMVIVLLGFAAGNRVLLGLGIVSLLAFISSYYYLLDTTLLAKSQTLLVVGLVLLAARWLLNRLIPAAKEEASNV